MSGQLQQLIQENRALFWSVGDANLDKIDENVVVETILNYGDVDGVVKLFSILGIKKTASIFGKQIAQKRHNYFPQVANYFNLYFKKHVPEYS